MASTQTTLYLATGNAHKVDELTRMIQEARLPLLAKGAQAVGGMPTVEETGKTFLANARLKALALFSKLREEGLESPYFVLSDDSGLSVDFLNGDPGVLSARYAGEDATDERNVEKLLQALEGVPDDRRSASFHCALVLLNDSGIEHTFEGECSGRVIRQTRGTGGFGYDPVFIADGLGETFSQIPAELKNRLSHRGRALGQLVDFLQQVLV